ncbi:type II toxin-antitoxin system RelE/ParE family toxin [Ekhidna sp.]|uniref:type II toxin-antitoxin system RelE/ParE family toxin n=1 Tax=Ekhidna sp. TaxID=2608089 RepID=UPI003C7CECCA
MRVIYTGQSIDSLEESLNFAIKERELSPERASSLKDTLLDRADSLGLNPYKGQREDYLKHLKQEHRRIIEGHFKIIYRVEREVIYITDFFDSRQSPSKMKG